MTTTNRMRALRTSQAGLTLIELMVVVAIVGFLMVTAMVTISKDPTAEDVGQRLSSLIAEASRKAVAGGAPDPDFIDTQKSSGSPIACLGARTRVTIYPSGGVQYAVLQRLDETKADPWEEIIDERIINRNVEVAGYRNQAVLTADDAGPAVTSVSASTPIELCCNPDGSCQPDNTTSGLTIYLRESDTFHEARVVVMPLRGAPLVYSEW